MELLIGEGLAGSMAALYMYHRGINFRWADWYSPFSASRAAYGMVNPVWLKGMQLAWNAPELFSHARETHRVLQEESGLDFISTLPVWHCVADEEERQQWRMAYESSALFDYVDLVSGISGVKGIRSPAGFVEVRAAYRVDVPKFLEAVRKVMGKSPEQEQVHPEDFIQKENGWEWKGELYSAVTWCEGFEALHNPFWKALPWRPCKGSVLEILAPGLEEKAIVHKKIFLVPLGNHHFLAGSDYRWDSLDPSPDESGENSLRDDIRNLVDVSFEVIAHFSGIRPAIADRRPVLGEHPLYPGMYVLNALGSKGLMYGPWCAEQLMKHRFENGIIPKEIDVWRFKKRLEHR